MPVAVAVVAPAPVAAAVVVPLPAVASPPTTVAMNPSNLASAMQALQALGDDKPAKKAYIATLPAALQTEVMQALKTQKEEADKRNAELDDLL